MHRPRYCEWILQIITFTGANLRQAYSIDTVYSGTSRLFFKVYLVSIKAVASSVAYWSMNASLTQARNSTAPARRGSLRKKDSGA